MRNVKRGTSRVLEKVRHQAESLQIGGQPGSEDQNIRHPRNSTRYSVSQNRRSTIATNSQISEHCVIIFAVPSQSASFHDNSTAILIYCLTGTFLRFKNSEVCNVPPMSCKQCCPSERKPASVSETGSWILRQRVEESLKFVRIPR